MLNQGHGIDPSQQRLRISLTFSGRHYTRNGLCCYGRDYITPYIDPELKGAQVATLQSIDNPRLFLLIEHYIQNYGA